MGFLFKYSRLDFTYLREVELANGIGGLNHIAQIPWATSTTQKT